MTSTTFGLGIFFCRGLADYEATAALHTMGLARRIQRNMCFLCFYFTWRQISVLERSKTDDEVEIEEL